MSYKETLEKITVLQNTWQSAVNQTEIYYLIKRHFDSPLPAGKKNKKAVVIGYDGCTAEMLGYLDNIESGAIKYLLENSGCGVFSFAGGRAYPEDIIQETSTAPGWCSMLTGVTVEENGIDDNGFPKAVEPKTLFISLPEENKAEKCAFYVSWGGHFVDDNSTYKNEKAYIEEHGINSAFVCAEGDEGTRENILSDITSPECSDFIFSIFEFCDENGHGYDYRPEVKEYMKAFTDSDKVGMEIISAIKNRPTFDSEDWLVLVTSDHGGIRCGHGGPSLQERITFIVSNKEI